jgi:hypothetical protein
MPNESKDSRGMDAPPRIETTADEPAKNYFLLQEKKWQNFARHILEGNEGMAAIERFAGLTQLILGDNQMSPAETLDKFRFQIDCAREDVKDRLAQFVPQEIFERLMPPVQQTNEPMDLFSSLLHIDSLLRNEPTKKIGFELLRDMELAILYLFVSSHLEVESHQCEIEDREVKEFITQARIAETRITNRGVEVYLNPKNNWRFAGFRPLKKKYLKRVVIPATQVELKGFLNTRVRCLIQGRRKDTLGLLARRFRDAHSENIKLMTDVPDLFGVRLTYFTPKDFHNGIEIVRSYQIMQFDNTLRNIPESNKHASKLLNIVSQRAFVNGRFREIQHISIADLVNILFATSEDSHALYHLRCYLAPGGLFHQLWPTETYKVDWLDPKIRETCRAFIIEDRIAKNRKLTVS